MKVELTKGDLQELRRVTMMRVADLQDEMPSSDLVMAGELDPPSAMEIAELAYLRELVIKVEWLIKVA